MPIGRPSLMTDRLHVGTSPFMAEKAMAILLAQGVISDSEKPGDRETEPSPVAGEVAEAAGSGWSPMARLSYAFEAPRTLETRDTDDVYIYPPINMIGVGGIELVVGAKHISPDGIFRLGGGVRYQYARRSQKVDILEYWPPEEQKVHMSMHSLYWGAEGGYLWRLMGSGYFLGFDVFVENEWPMDVDGNIGGWDMYKDYEPDYDIGDAWLFGAALQAEKRKILDISWLSVVASIGLAGRIFNDSVEIADRACPSIICQKSVKGSGILFLGRAGLELW